MAHHVQALSKWGIVAMIGTCPIEGSRLERFLQADECHECTCEECDHVDGGRGFVTAATVGEQDRARKAENSLC